MKLFDGGRNKWESDGRPLGSGAAHIPGAKNVPWGAMVSRGCTVGVLLAVWASLLVKRWLVPRPEDGHKSGSGGFDP